jgi:hypothetical protein
MKLFGIEIPWLRRRPPTGCSYVPEYEGDLLRGPHCDPYVLHIDSCDLCLSDDYIEARAERIHKAINFTGSPVPGRSQCPAEARRSLEQIHAWPGNRPFKRQDAD